jgi:hypothetical protein
MLVTCDGNNSNVDISVTRSIDSVVDLDGWVRSDGDASWDRGGPLTGDFDSSYPGLGYRQFYSFDISIISPGNEIEEAFVHLYQANYSGDPYAELGSVIVDHVDYGDSLTSDDYDSAALEENIGTLSDNLILEYKTLDVTTYVRTDYTAARQYSQFRLRFSVADGNDDGGNDYVNFTDYEDSCCGVNMPPYLEVTYR